MDLSTTYLGLSLKNPLVASASPLSEELDNIRRMEDAGLAAVVHHSLFEEEITHESVQLHQFLTSGTESYAEALDYFPEPDCLLLGPEEYCRHIQAAKEAVQIPLIGSLNGRSLGGWTCFARMIEQAGADALELNLYDVPTDPGVSSAQLEETYLEIVRAVRQSIRIPLAVKLSPFVTSLPHLALRLAREGVDGLVLFNRFYQPDLDLENLEAFPNVILSTSHDLRLPLRWVAILYGEIPTSLAISSGVHQAEDVLKGLMAGADVTMMCSALLRHGIPQAGRVLEQLRCWMQEHEYESVSQMKGSLSLKACPDPTAFERAHYLKALRSFRISSRTPV